MQPGAPPGSVAAMRRILILALLPIAVAGAAPAGASDVQLRFVMHRTIQKVGYIGRQAGRSKDPVAVAHFAARMARAARRAGHLLSRLQPSSRVGAAARHEAVQGLRQVRIAGRLFLMSINTSCECRASRYAEQALKRELRGLGQLVLAWSRLLLN